MAFNSDNLTSYVELKSKEIASKAVGGAKTAALLIQNGAVQTGIKTQAPVLQMNTDIVLQDGSSCGRLASGSTKLSNKMLVVKPIKSNENLCPKDLYGKYYAWALKAGQDPESEGYDNAFVQAILDQTVEGVASENEKMLWQGDTSLSGSTNLKRIDGLLKQIIAGSYIDISNSGADIIAKLQQAYLKMPVEVRNKPDFRLFIGEDTYDEYITALANKNIFKSTDDITLFGSRAKLEPIPGLNGTNTIVAARISNLQLGLDLEGDADKVSFKYSQETEQWYKDVHYVLGIVPIYVEEIGYYHISPTTTTTTTLG